MLKIKCVWNSFKYFFSNSDVIGVDYLALLAQLKTKNITSSVELNVSAMGKLFHD